MWEALGFVGVIAAISGVFWLASRLVKTSQDTSSGYGEGDSGGSTDAWVAGSGGDGGPSD